FFENKLITWVLELQVADPAFCISVTFARIHPFNGRWSCIYFNVIRTLFQGQIFTLSTFYTFIITDREMCNILATDDHDVGRFAFRPSWVSSRLWNANRSV